MGNFGLARLLNSSSSPYAQAQVLWRMGIARPTVDAPERHSPHARRRIPIACSSRGVTSCWERPILRAKPIQVMGIEAITSREACRW